MIDVSRRSVLLAASATLAVVGADTLFGGSPASAVTPTPTPSPSSSPLPTPSPPTGALTGATSPNGWPVNSAADVGGTVWTRPLAGTGSAVQVAIGDAEVVLVHVVRRFHYEVDTLRPGEVVGFRSATGLSGYQLNHASGTAVDIRPGYYPPGVRGGFTAPELAVVKDILAECEGVVTWGGDLPDPDESHFQVDVPPTDERFVKLVAKLRGWNAAPGRGAGVLQDPTDPRRLASVRALPRRRPR